MIPFWIGVNDAQGDGSYVYSSDDTTAISYENWATNEPDDTDPSAISCVQVMF